MKRRNWDAPDQEDGIEFTRHQPAIHSIALGPMLIYYFSSCAKNMMHSKVTQRILQVPVTVCALHLGNKISSLALREF